ncbi:MAG: hypothetical protein WA990_04380 [Rubrobacteraceae bacterium]
MRIVETVVRNFFRHRMTTYAAALAYRALFGLLPLVFLVVALLGFMDTYSHVTPNTQRAAFARLGERLQRS